MRYAEEESHFKVVFVCCAVLCNTMPCDATPHCTAPHHNHTTTAPRRALLTMGQAAYPMELMAIGGLFEHAEKDALAMVRAGADERPGRQPTRSRSTYKGSPGVCLSRLDVPASVSAQARRSRRGRGGGASSVGRGSARAAGDPRRLPRVQANAGRRRGGAKRRCRDAASRVQGRAPFRPRRCHAPPKHAVDSFTAHTQAFKIAPIYRALVSSVCIWSW